MKTPQPARYTITAALPYANGPMHIGHMGGVYIPADTFVRYLRRRGREVLFVCGSDEHGAAITLRARKEGTTPRAIVDKYHAINRQAFADFGIAFDIYHRTSEALHHETASDFFKTLNDKGSFDVERSEQFFDPQEQVFLADRYIMGICPKCGNENAYGDQCEKCGSTLSPTDLINPRSVLSGATPVMRETRHWYLPMQNHEVWLREWLLNGVLNGQQHHNPADWKKQVIGQCKSWLDQGLQPRAMTRDLDWGVPVPLPDAEGKVLYVWLDAPIGYISATREWARQHNTDWERWWKSDDTALIHFLAKDNIVFPCIIFPIILREHGGYILPTNVPANEFLNLEGQKISTSRNWAVWLHEYLEDFPGREDELRYVLTSIAPEFRDSEFTWADFQARVNNELVAVLGNFVNRAMVLTQKYFEGIVPPNSDSGLEEELRQRLRSAPETIAELIENYRFRDAQAEVMNLARYGNKLLTETEPWKLIKTAPEKAGAVLNATLQICAAISLLGDPFLPRTCAKIRSMLNLDNAQPWERAAEPMLATHHQLGNAHLLFQKVEDAHITAQTEKLFRSMPQTPAAETPKQASSEKKSSVSEIQFDDFAKIQLKAGKILTAQRVEGTDKLMQLSIDLGEASPRTIVSGIAQHFSADELPGQWVTVVANLAPRKMRGILSQGMVLMAENEAGKLIFIAPQGEVKPGAEIR